MSLNVRDLLSATAYDNNGDKLGDVNEVFVDDASGQPTFVDVNHGLFGMGNSLVPLRGHSVDGDSLTLGFAKDRIKNAPDFDSDKPLTPQQQTEIYEHYGISEAADVQGYTGGERLEATDATEAAEATETSTADTKAAGAGPAGAGVAGAGAAGAGVAGAGVTGAAATDSGTSDSTTDEERPRPDFSDNVRSDEAATAGNSATETPAASTAAAGAGGVAGTSTADGSASDASTNGANNNEMIRSEEHLNVDTERVQTGEARLRKYVVTETETVEVPVTREEVKVERTPIDPDDASSQAVSGGLDSNLTEEEASVTLHEERPVVNKETVPVEKVNLSAEQVSDTERVSEEVRKEQIEADGIDGFDEQK